jgi:signal transduction histidine kinase
MEIAALFVTIMIGLSAVFLSLENDSLRKYFTETKKAEEDRLYKLDVIKDLEEKIAYTTDPEKVVDEVIISLRNFYNYSAVSSMVIKDANIVFKIYAEEDIGLEYVGKVEEDMLSSFEKLVGKLSLNIDRKIFGKPIDNGVKSTYLSSFHIPLVANNKVLAIIHLSSFSENAFTDMKDLHAIMDSASSALTHFSQTVNSETEKLNDLINSINDGILMIDNKNNLLTVNDSAQKILRVQANANFFDIVSVFGENFNLENVINEVTSTKSPNFGKEIKANDRILNIFVNPVENNKVSVVLRDITEDKKKELQKEDLIHIMVHELRAPTTTIKDSAELIITSEDSLGADKKLKFLEIIHTQAKRVLGQIGSILDTAKLDAGKLVLQKTKGDIAKLIKEEVQNFMPQAERKNISLNFNLLNDSLPLISFDEIRVSQAIDNLLSNSLKFTPEGGKIKVDLDYKVIPPVVDGTSPMGEFLSLDKFIIVSVSDSGVGITPEQQKLLFSKYVQAKNTSEKVATMGTGLGLYLAKGIVEAHNGRIWVKSALGQGTTFSFTLPATDDTKSTYEAPKPTMTPLAKLSQTVN